MVDMKSVLIFSFYHFCSWCSFVCPNIKICRYAISLLDLDNNFSSSLSDTKAMCCSLHSLFLYTAAEDGVHVKSCAFSCWGVYKRRCCSCGVQILSDTQSQSCSLISAHLLLTPSGCRLFCVLDSTTAPVLWMCVCVYVCILLVCFWYF